MMTDEELQEIRDTVHWMELITGHGQNPVASTASAGQVLRLLKTLLVEVERMREIVQTVAALWVHCDPDNHISLYARDNEIDVEALREKARQLVNKDSQQ